jgi:hypothetical protein
MQRTTSDASTILLIYRPSYSSLRILNLPLPLCTIFASNVTSSIYRKHQQGYVKGFAPNAAYAMTGSEKYINSGWLLPKGQEQGFRGSSNTFTVTYLFFSFLLFCSKI